MKLIWTIGKRIKKKKIEGEPHPDVETAPLRSRGPLVWPAKLVSDGQVNPLKPARALVLSVN